MPFVVTMPKLSPTMEEGTIVKWHAKEGDLVNAGQLLLEVATDKATVEYNALDEGYLRKILVSENQSAVVNKPIAIFSVAAQESLEGFQIEEKKEEIPQTQLPKEECKEEKEPIEKLQASAGAFQLPDFAPEPPLENYNFPTNSSEYIRISPLAKKIAEEKGIDVTSVKGTGPKGRVMSRDLETAAAESVVSFKKNSWPVDKPGSFEEKPLSPMRKTIGKRLQESKSFIPHFYVHQEVEVSKLVELRQQLKDFSVKLTYNDFIVRAVALALREHPIINSGFHAKKQARIAFKTIDIAIAVALEDGLITPIIRHADFKNIGEISQEVKLLVKKAKEGKLAPEEYKGGSFTLSNLGMYGISHFEAIINPPQSSILSIGGILDQPVVKEGVVVPGKVLKLTLSSDHRIVDGKDAAAFLHTLQKLVECPSILLI